MHTKSLRMRLTRLLRHEVGRIARGASFIFVARVIGAVTIFATQVLLARWAGPEEMGIYVYAFAWCILLTTLAGLGFPMAAYRFIGQGLAHGQEGSVKGFVRRGWQLASTTGIAIAAVGAAVVSGGNGWVPASQHQTLLLALLCVPIYAVMDLNGGAAQGLSWFRVAFLPAWVFRPLLLLLAMGAVKLTIGTLSAAIVMALHAGILLLLTAGQFRLLSVALDRKFPQTPPRYETGLWVRTAAPLLVIALFGNYFTELNLIVAGALLSAEEIGVFNAAMRTAFLIGFGIYAVDAITIPRASLLHASGDAPGLQRLVSNAAHLRFWGSLAAVIVLVLTGESVLALFGKEFVTGYWPLMILAAAQLIIAVFGPTTQLLSISGHQNHCLYVFFFSLIALVVLHGLLIPRLGLIGAALGMALVVLLQSAWLYLIVVRRLGIRPSVFASQRASDSSERA